MENSHNILSGSVSFSDIVKCEKISLKQLTQLTAPVGIDYGILNAFFIFFFQYSSLSKIFCQISVKNRHAHVQFYLRRVQSFCSVDVRFHGNRKSRSANIKNLILPFFHDRRHFVL